MNTKKMTIEEYVKRFCKDLRLRKRKAIYVRPDVHQQMEILARILKWNGHDASISAIATMIFVNHFNTYGYIHKQLEEYANKKAGVDRSGDSANYKPA
jgi:hypothetical protein